MPRRRPYKLVPLPEQIVADARQLADCLTHIRLSQQIGFDTEFVGEDTYRPDLCLVQVATSERLYLIDPLACGPLDEFWQLLLDPKRQTIVHAGREEIRMCWFATGFPPANLVDLQVAAALVGLQYSIGYAALVQEVLGVRMDKGETLTDWRRRPLTPGQIRYAYDDVRYLLPIWDRISDKLTKHRRLDWAREEFAVSIKRAVADDPTVERWRKLKGVGALRPRELAIVRAVHAWRESVANRQNRPARTVLRDDLVVEIARRAGEKQFDLTSLRGVPKNEVTAITAAIREALALTADHWPLAAERDNDPPHVAQVAALLAIVLAEYSAREAIAPASLATMSDLKALVRARQPDGRLPPESPFFTGWRASTVLPYLEAFLDGRMSIRIDDPASESPIRIEPVS